ncbi:MAG: type II toxin-antitoxin system RelE/ParE family toxin [bacterium]|nr:type II toxin-antitoxin system RelE/ParE family toxin [bacterium]
MIIQYYVLRSGRCEVKDFIDGLLPKQKAKIFRLFQAIEVYGMITVTPHIKKLSNSELWELRILGKDSIRLFYIIFNKDNVIIFHGFIKKTNKTPMKELRLAENIFHEWKNRVDK